MNKEVQGQDNNFLLNDFLLADKVRVRSGEHKGAKGSILSQKNDMLEVLLNSGEHIYVAPRDIVNQSRASRRAWATIRKHREHEVS